MGFYRGQSVVCVREAFAVVYAWSDGEQPRAGQVYRVTDSFHICGEPVLGLAGLEGSEYALWDAFCFRPAAEGGLEILLEIAANPQAPLKGAPQEAPALTPGPSPERERGVAPVFL
jgi:hypothetical protein